MAVPYEPMIHVFVPVNRELEQWVRKRMPDRVDDVDQIDHAVDVAGLLAGRRVLIYGIGRHAQDLALVFACRKAEIVGVIDDHGRSRA